MNLIGAQAMLSLDRAVRMRHVDPGAKFGMELRGLFGMVVRDIVLIRLREREAIVPQYEVGITIQVPDREDASKLIELHFREEFSAQYHHLDRGLTPEQSCILQSIKVLWEHELDESIIVGGVRIWDPHDPSRRPMRR